MVIIPQAAQSSRGNRPYPRGASRRLPIEAAKAAVPVVDLAVRLAGPLKASGERLIGHCPLPDHDDRTPSFTVYQETNSWWCYGCARGGDVVDLAALTWGFDNLGEAAGYLLLEFGHEVPQRPASWYRKQERQKDVRDAIDRERVEHVRLLVFRLIWMPWLKSLPGTVREEAAESAWEQSRSMALRLYEKRRGIS